MSPALGKPSAVQRNEIANVVGHQHPIGLVRGLQLLLVSNSTEPKLICGSGVKPVLLERPRQRVGLAILVPMDNGYRP